MFKDFKIKQFSKKSMCFGTIPQPVGKVVFRIYRCFRTYPNPTCFGTYPKPTCFGTVLDGFTPEAKWSVCGRRSSLKSVATQGSPSSRRTFGPGTVPAVVWVSRSRKWSVGGPPRPSRPAESRYPNQFNSLLAGSIERVRSQMCS